MTGSAKPFDPAYFARLYGDSDDPWGLAASDYERSKYAETLAMLPRPRFGRALEVGCSIGILSAGLARRCEHLLAVDISDRAVAIAQRRCAGLGNVSFARMCIPTQWPAGAVDLMLFSEVLYYLDDADLAATAACAIETLTRAGWVVLVNWTGPSTLPISGDHAAAVFIEGSRKAWAEVTTTRREGFRIDLLRCGSG